MAVTALQLWAAQNHGALLVVSLLLVPAVATLIGGRAAGVLSQRAQARRVIIIASAMESLVYLLLGVTDAVPFILVFIGVDAFLALVRTAAVMSVVPEMSRRSASESFGLLQAATTLGRLAGPAIGAGAMAAWGLTTAMLINAVSFLGYALLVGSVRNAALRRPPAAPTAPTDQESARPALGYRGLLAGPVGPPIVTLLIGIFFTVIVDAALVLYALYQLKVHQFGFATLATCWSIGIIISSRLPLSDTLPRLRRSLVIATGVLGAALSVDAAVVWFPVSVAAALVAGTAHGTQNRVLPTMIAIGISEQERNVAFALFGALANGVAAAGLVAATALVPLAGPRVAVLVAGLGTAASMGAALLARRRRADQGQPARGRRAT